MSDLDVRLRALRSRTRREILALVWDRELPAGDIAAAFALRQATISEHLAVLRAAGLVQMNRVGTSRRYRARPEALTGLHLPTAERAPRPEISRRPRDARRRRKRPAQTPRAAEERCRLALARALDFGQKSGVLSAAPAGLSRCE